MLALFRSRPLIGAAECARLLDMPPASAHRMLVSLAAAGALEVTAKGQYRLTLRMFELGYHVPYQRWLFDAAYLPMESLITRTGLSAHFAVRDDAELVYLVKLRHAPDRTRARAGERNSLHATAIGKVLLAHTPPDVVNDVLSKRPARFTPYTITMSGQLAPSSNASARRASPTTTRSAPPRPGQQRNTDRRPRRSDRRAVAARTRGEVRPRPGHTQTRSHRNQTDHRAKPHTGPEP